MIITGYSGLFTGTKGDKLRRFNEVENQLFRLSQFASDVRLNVFDFIDQTKRKELATPFELQMIEIADQLEAVRHYVWHVIDKLRDSRGDYIAEGYPGSN